MNVKTTGVIVGLPFFENAEPDAVHEISADLAAAFPGVRVAIVLGATGIATFTFEEPGEPRPLIIPAEPRPRRWWRR